MLNKMVKIIQKGVSKIKLQNYTEKMHFARAMDEVENLFKFFFFWPVSKSMGPSDVCQGWVVMPKNVKKSLNHCTLLPREFLGNQRN